jgi:EAL domain-containing protein (putative c-di-GMP-specific phosphodiesterase class I)
MRTAKRDGRNTIRFYNESLQDMTKHRSQMLQYLKESILKNELFLNYQKQFDKNENVVGVEALIRWNHPLLGNVSPAEFIPLAEESGVIKEIGTFVLESAANKLLLWSDDPIKREWRISVNVSPLQFREESFVESIKRLISSKNIDATKLRVELTEGVLIENKEQAINKIRDLKNFGISTSIDDFGTGYSNLGYLKNLQIDELKIDQSFIFELNQSSSDKTIVRTIIMLGEEFNFEVIAEGVETREQFEILKELGCNYFQGYLLAKPCKAEEL